MAWKNLKQRSLGDALLIDHEALQELDGVHGLLISMQNLLGFWVEVFSRSLPAMESEARAGSPR